MGFQDRDYNSANYYESNYGEGQYQQRFGLGGTRDLVVTKIVIICAVIWFANFFFPPIKLPEGIPPELASQAPRVLMDTMALDSDMFFKPWKAYQLFTYGFAHSEQIWHVLFNMFTLWMFGSIIEQKYGKREFLAFYLLSILFAGFVWVLVRTLFGSTAMCVGASGGVSAVLILFVFNFPNVKVSLFGVIPMPAWVLGLGIVGYDALSALFSSETVAHDAHLAGAAFAAGYHYLGWNFTRMLGLAELSEWWRARRSGIRIHNPDDGDEDALADEILDKLHREGQDSLTRKEKKILEAYSRRMREQRQNR